MGFVMLALAIVVIACIAAAQFGIALALATPVSALVFVGIASCISGWLVACIFGKKVFFEVQFLKYWKEHAAVTVGMCALSFFATLALGHAARWSVWAIACVVITDVAVAWRLPYGGGKR